MRAAYTYGRFRGLRAATIVLLGVAAASVVLSAQTNQLRLVSTAWPPFTNAPGQPRFALDLVEAALRRVGVTANTTIVDAARFTPALLNSEFDGSAAVWKDDERERVMLFSQPYLENRLVLIGRKGVDVSATALGALKAKRIALVDGYSYGPAVESAGPTYVRSRSEEDSLSLLLSNRADYALMDEIVVQHIVDNYANEARTRLQLGSTPLVTRQLYLAVRRERPDAESIISRFNAQLRGMIADHTYHQLLHVQWILADIDGDGVPEYVPQTDRPGPLEPQRAYAISSTAQSSSPSSEIPKRFYVGGSIYSDWASVPQNYKVSNSDRPDPSRSAASIFKFSW